MTDISEVTRRVETTVGESVYNGGPLTAAMLPQWLEAHRADGDRNGDITDSEAKALFEEHLLPGTRFEDLYNPRGFSPKMLLAALGHVPHVSYEVKAPRYEFTNKDLEPFPSSPRSMQCTEDLGPVDGPTGRGRVQFGLGLEADFRQQALDFAKSGRGQSTGGATLNVAHFLVDFDNANINTVRGLADFESKLVINPKGWVSDHQRTLRMRFYAVEGMPATVRHGQEWPAQPEVKQGFASVDVDALKDMMGGAEHLEFYIEISTKDGGNFALNKDGERYRNWIITRDMLGMAPAEI